MLYYLQKSPVRKVLKKPRFLICQNQNVLLTGLIPAFSQGPACKWKIWKNLRPPLLTSLQHLGSAVPGSGPLLFPPLTPLQYSRGLQEQEVCRLPASCLVGCGLALEADACWGAAPTPALVSGALLAFWNHLKPFALVRCCSIGDGCGSMYIMKMKNRLCSQLFF